MPKRFIRAASLAVLGMLAACAEPSWVPGPGKAGYTLGVDQGHCRLIARGMASGTQFGVSGSPKFVAAAAASALVIGAIGGAIENETNYRNCMMAQNWLIGDPRPPSLIEPPSQSKPPITAVASITVPAPISNADTTMPSARAATVARNDLLVRGVEVTPARAQALKLSATRGVVLLDVMYGGAGSLAGLQVGDTILAFNGARIDGVADLQLGLGQIGAGAKVTAAVWRDGRLVPVRLQF